MSRKTRVPFVRFFTMLVMLLSLTGMSVFSATAAPSSSGSAPQARAQDATLTTEVCLDLFDPIGGDPTGGDGVVTEADLVVSPPAPGIDFDGTDDDTLATEVAFIIGECGRLLAPEEPIGTADPLTAANCLLIFDQDEDGEVTLDEVENSNVTVDFDGDGDLDADDLTFIVATCVDLLAPDGGDTTVDLDLCVLVDVDEDGVITQTDIDAAVAAGDLDLVADAELIVLLLGGACDDVEGFPPGNEDGTDTTDGGDTTVDLDLCVLVDVDEDGVITQADIDAAVEAGDLDLIIDADLILLLLGGACDDVEGFPPTDDGADDGAADGDDGAADDGPDDGADDGAADDGADDGAADDGADDGAADDGADDGAADDGADDGAADDGADDGAADDGADDGAADDGADDGAADDGDDDGAAVTGLPSTGQGSDAGANGSAIVLLFGAMSMVALAAGFAWRQRHTI